MHLYATPYKWSFETVQETHRHRWNVSSRFIAMFLVAAVGRLEAVVSNYCKRRGWILSIHVQDNQSVVVS